MLGLNYVAQLLAQIHPRLLSVLALIFVHAGERLTLRCSRQG